MAALRNVCGDGIINRPLRAALSPDVTSCDFYLGESFKDTVYQNNPHTEDELKVNITSAIMSMSR